MLNKLRNFLTARDVTNPAYLPEKPSDPFEDLHRFGRLNPKSEADMDHIRNYLTFTDKQSYLQWRGEWRMEYNAITLVIQGAKKRMRVPGGDSAAQMSRSGGRRIAYNLMLLRTESKKLAAQQRTIPQ